MDQRLKQRLVGATVLVVLAVVFLPMLLDETGLPPEEDVAGMPPRPEPLEQDARAPLLPPEPFDAGPPLPAGSAAPGEPAAEGEAPADGTVAPDPQTSVPPAAGGSAWAVQLGSFASAANAQSLVDRLRGAGFRAFVTEVRQDGQSAFKVRVGPEVLRSQAERVRERLAQEQKLEGMLVPHP